MTNCFSRIGTIGLLVAFAAFAVSPPALAESKTLRLHAQRPPGYMSSTVSAVGDVPRHEFSHRVFSLTITGSDPEVNGLKTTNYVQSEDVAGTGTYRDYATWPLSNGDTVYIKFNGTHKTIMKGGGDWEAPFEGRFEFVGGTGKYKNIKKGTVTTPA